MWHTHTRTQLIMCEMLLYCKCKCVSCSSLLVLQRSVSYSYLLMYCALSSPSNQAWRALVLASRAFRRFISGVLSDLPSETQRAGMRPSVAMATAHFSILIHSFTSGDELLHSSSGHSAQNTLWTKSYVLCNVCASRECANVLELTNLH